MPKRLIVGISGASGAPLAVSLLKALRDTEYETHLIISEGGKKTILHETHLTIGCISELADVVYDNTNIGAGPASGSFKTAGMVVIPCSMKTVSGIHSGYSDNLLLRAADVTIKERRKLVLVARECPLSSIHLRNLYELSTMGAVIMPPMLEYYNNPTSIEDHINHIVGKILDQFNCDYLPFKRWEG